MKSSLAVLSLLLTASSAVATELSLECTVRTPIGFSTSERAIEKVHVKADGSAAVYEYLRFDDTGYKVALRPLVTEKGPLPVFVGVGKDEAQIEAVVDTNNGVVVLSRDIDDSESVAECRTTTRARVSWDEVADIIASSNDPSVSSVFDETGSR